MRGKGLLCVLLLWAVAATGCTYQKMVAASSAEPDWAVKAPANTGDRFTFVGKGLGDNIVDSRQAAERAMLDVRDQLAKSLTNRAVVLAVEMLDQKGVAHNSVDAEGATFARLVGKQVDQAMPSLQQDATYWEKWMIKPDLFVPSYSKFEFCVEVSMPKEQYGKLAADLAEQIAGEIEARTKPATPAAPTEGEAAPKP